MFPICLYVMKTNVVILIASAIVLSCSSKLSDGTDDVSSSNGFSLEKVNDTLFNLVLETDGSSDVWKLPYPVYRFCTGDIDGDSVIDAIVGVEKTTRYDPVVRKRVFVFHNFEGKVRPLWMGSRLGRPVVDFRIVQVDGETRLRSMEEEQSGKFLVAEYRWKSFGVKFIRYICREFELENAVKELDDK